MQEAVPYVASAIVLVALIAAGTLARRRWPGALMWRRAAPAPGSAAWRIGRWNWRIGMIGGAIGILTAPTWSAVPELRSLMVIPAICAVIDYAFIRNRIRPE